jgi:hypothetical protein
VSYYGSSFAYRGKLLGKMPWVHGLLRRGSGVTVAPALFLTDMSILQFFQKRRSAFIVGS